MAGSKPTLDFNETTISFLDYLTLDTGAGGVAIPYVDGQGNVVYQPDGAVYPNMSDVTSGGSMGNFDKQILALLGDCWGILTNAPRPLKNGKGGHVFKSGIYPLGDSSLNVNDFILPP